MANPIPLKLTDNGSGVGTLAEFAADDVIPTENLPAFEPPVVVGTTQQYWRGDKSWQDFNAAARAAALSGVVFTANSAVVAADSFIVAFGKLQTQINNRLLTTGTAAAATKLATARTINGVNFDGTANITVVDSSAIPLTQRGAANGVATLDGSGTVPASQLPSYVDDVLDYPTYADLPATGETGKIYVLGTPYTVNGMTSSQFRWSGSAYAAIIASPGSTDAVTEGSTNLYFTTNRVRQTLLAGLNLAISGAIAATDNILSALGKLQYQINNLTKANVGLERVDNTADVDKPVSTAVAVALADTGGQNLTYNSSFLKVSAAASNLGDGWEFDGPGQAGSSTGVISLITSFLTPGENTQRIVVTNLNTSTLYRSLVNTIARASRVSPGQTIVSSVRVKGTAGLRFRIFLQAVASNGSAIAAPASGFFTLTGDIQNLSFAYPNLPANTVGVRSFYRIYAGDSVTDGTVDMARPKTELGNYATGWSEDTIVIREDIAARATANNASFTGDATRINTASTVIGNGLAANAGIELGSTVSGTATTPFIDFHSGSAPVDYDARMLASGGTGTSGAGTLSFTAGNINIFSDLTVQRAAQSCAFLMKANAGQYRFTRFMTDNTVRWDVGISNDPESGSSAGANYYMNAFTDAGAYIHTPLQINRASGQTTLKQLAVTGPVKVGQYTLSTLPAASAYNGYEIDVTDAAGGSKRCRSSGTNWLILNTTTPVA